MDSGFSLLTAHDLLSKDVDELKALVRQRRGAEAGRLEKGGKPGRPAEPARPAKPAAKAAPAEEKAPAGVRPRCSAAGAGTLTTGPLSGTGRACCDGHRRP